MNMSDQFVTTDVEPGHQGTRHGIIPSMYYCGIGFAGTHADIGFLLKHHDAYISFGKLIGYPCTAYTGSNNGKIISTHTTKAYTNFELL